MSSVQLISAEAAVRPDGTVSVSVGGAALPDGQNVPMDRALQVLSRYAAVYGDLDLTTRFPDGRVSGSRVTALGATVVTAGTAGDLAPEIDAATAEDLQLLSMLVETLPPPDRTGKAAIRPNAYKAPGLDSLRDQRRNSKAGIAHNLFRGTGIDESDPIGGREIPLTLTRSMVPLEDVPEFDVEGDMQRAQVKKNERPPIPARAFVALGATLALCILGFFALF